MARFSKNTITQLAGFDSDVIAEELLFGEDAYWNLTITTSKTDPTPVNLTDWTFKFRLIRRMVDSIDDGRNGIDIVGLRAASGAAEMDLDTNVKVFNPTGGQVRLLIDDTFFSQVQPVIDTDQPPVYTGYFAATLPESGTVGDVSYIPPQTKKVLLLFIVRSDGISAQTA